MDSIALVVYTILRSSGRIVEEWDELRPRVTPHVDSPGVLCAELFLKLSEPEFRGFQCRSGVEFLHPLDDFLPIAISHKPHCIADDVNNAGLHYGLGEDRADRVRQAGETVAAGDQDVANAAVAQVREYLLPELRPFSVLDPAAQGMLAAVYVDPDGQVSDLGGDHAVVLDPDPDPVHVEDGVHLVQGPRLP